MKAIKYIAIGGGVILLGKYLLSLDQAQKRAVISATGKIDKLTAQGLSLILRYNIKNPSTGNLRMTPPLIKLSVAGNLIASSNMQMIDIPENVRDKSGKIIIRPFSETGDIQARILIPWLNLVGVAPDLLKRVQSKDSKDKIKIQVETLSQAYTLVGSFPYRSLTAFKL